MLKVANCHDSVTVHAFRKDLVNGTSFYDFLTIRIPTKMVDVLSRVCEFVILEDDRMMSRGDRPKERSDQYRDT